jgi:hypothetical protein
MVGVGQRLIIVVMVVRASVMGVVGVEVGVEVMVT